MSRRRRTPLELVRTWGRLLQIVWVVLVEAVGGRLAGRARAEVIHRAVVRLGPTFIKLGQIASTRPDLVPADVSERLESLQERVPEFSFEEARRRVEAELGMALEDAYTRFPDRPIAAASLSQVYFAELTDGTPVAVKVRRPDIRRVVERDLAILRALAWLAALAPSVRKLRPVRAVDEFGRWTLRELDFRVEGQNFDAFRRNFAGWDDVAFPEVYWTHTTEAVLTMERMAGMRLREVPAALGPAAAERLAHRLAELEMKMFISDQFFHADLHPGNIFFRPDGSIAVLDVGMVGRMTIEQRDRFLAYWIAVSRQQRERAFHHLLAMAESTAGADLSGFHAAYHRILDQFYGRTLVERSLARTYLEIVVTGSRHGVVFPSALILQAKAVVTAEALTLVLAPDFEFAEQVRPIVARELARRATPAALFDRLWGQLTEWVVLGEAAPPGPPPDAGLAEERSFRRQATGALAQVWAEAADNDLQRIQAEVDDVARASWWQNRPELHTLLVQVVGLLRQLAGGLERVRAEGGDPVDEDAIARIFADDDADGPERWERFLAATDEAGGAGPVATLDELSRQARRLADPAHWEGAHVGRASASSALASLRHLAGQAARTAREAAERRARS